MKTFLEAAHKNPNIIKRIDDWVNRWHKSLSNVSLRTYLGMTQAQYELWVLHPRELENIVKEHHGL